MEKIEIKKTYYPNGQIAREESFKNGNPLFLHGTNRHWYENGVLEWEGNFKNGAPHGPNRRWFENGVLASEIIYKEGVPDGIGKQWDKNGNLILSYEIKNGTGIQKSWTEEQGLGCEISLVNGAYTGRHRTYCRDGEIVRDIYWIRNRQVSKKKYIEMCELDETLPRYDDLVKDKKTIKKPHKGTTLSEGSYFDHETYYKKLFSEHQMVDALQWLVEPDVPERTLGECARPEDSVELVKNFYILGAVKVWTFDIDGAPDEEQNSGKLVIELPENRPKRKKIFEECNGIATEKGFDAESDFGQKYTLVMLD